MEASNRGHPNKGLNLDQGGGSGPRGFIIVTRSHQGYIRLQGTLGTRDRVQALWILPTMPSNAGQDEEAVKQPEHLFGVLGIATWETGSTQMESVLTCQQGVQAYEDKSHKNLF